MTIPDDRRPSEQRLVPVKTGATYADLEALPPGQRGELVDGALYLQSSPTVAHQEAFVELRAQLPKRAQGWRIVPGVDVRLSPTTVLCPDLAGWRLDRFAPGEAEGVFAQLPIAAVPDWVCEVLSPSTRAYDRMLKGDKYLRGGVQWRWLVDTREQYVEVYQANAERDHWVLWAEASSADRLVLAPFDAVIDLSLLWEPA